MTRKQLRWLIFTLQLVCSLFLAYCFWQQMRIGGVVWSFVPFVVWLLSLWRNYRRQLIDNLVFVGQIIIVTAGAVFDSPTFILLLAVLASSTAWHSAALLLRLHPFADHPETTRIIHSNLRIQAGIALISILLQLIVTNITFQLSLRLSMVLAAVLIFSIVTAMRYLRDSDG